MEKKIITISREFGSGGRTIGRMVAEKLGIHRVMLYRWIDEYQTYGDEAFVGIGHLKPADAELRKLRKENERLRMENEILKKAAAYFAKHPADGSSSPKQN